MNRCKLLAIGLAAAALAAIGAAGYGFWRAGHRPTAFRVALRGSVSTSDTLGVSCGNLAVIAPRPGFLFGTVRGPGGEEKFSYVIAFKYGLKTTDGFGHEVKFRCTSDGGRAETNDEIGINGRRMNASYHIELDKAHAAIAREMLEVGGEAREIESGRLFLVDLSVEPLVYRQLKLELPSISVNMQTPEDVERMAETIRASLELQSQDVRDFLR